MPADYFMQTFIGHLITWVVSAPLLLLEVDPSHIYFNPYLSSSYLPEGRYRKRRYYASFIPYSLRTLSLRLSQALGHKGEERNVPAIRIHYQATPFLSL